ncbi:ATP-binding protein [Porticoccaceae bacterium nBUS_09]
MATDSGIEQVELKPPASALIQSLRSIGYSFNSAVADIVDNSIAAKASSIEIIVDSDVDGLYVSISDNGYGMSRAELLNAMSLGSKNPLEQRRNDDLGRFGMGLKTASFSQATLLTCVTCKNGIQLGAQWDLEKVTDDWTIRLFNDQLCKELFSSYGNLGNDGTTIIWRNCDRVLENIKNVEMVEHRVGSLIIDLREHLALIFHKFLDGKHGTKVSISLNSIELQPKDPFCRATNNTSTTASTLMLDEKITLEGGDIKIRGYTLPHPSKIKTKALEHRISIDGDYFNSQGFYVYRAHRLLAWGSWFRILPKNESNKLARVELNIPNTMDELWRLDIKKSTVELPTEIRAQIKEKVKTIGLKSRKIFSRRTSLKRPGSKPIWLRSLNSDRQTISYKVDRSNDLIKLINGDSDASPAAMEALLSIIELALPLRLIENDLASNYNLGRFEGEEISEDIKLQVDALLTLGISEESILEHMGRDDSASIGAIDSLRRYIQKIIGAD